MNPATRILGAVSLLALSALQEIPGPGRAGLSLASWRARLAQAQGPGAPLRYRVAADTSEVRYRVREQLVGLSFPNDAVGVTSAIDGLIGLDAEGRLTSRESRVSVDLRSLRSDEARRDNYIRRNTLETDRYPTVVFVPVEVRGLRLPLASSGTASLEILGDLTVRDLTRRVTWRGTATFEGRDVRVRASTAFRFGDFALRIPRVAVVLSVEDSIRLEADLLLRPEP
jgi:polyisoprenoid-binding protein YceI